MTSTNTVVPPKTKSHSQTLPKRSSSGKRRVKLFNNPQGANNKFPTPKLPPPPGFNPPHVGDLNDINISAAGQLSTYSTLSSHGDLPLAPGKPKDLARNSDYGSYYSDLEDLFSAESEINVDTPLLTPGQGLTPLVNPSLSPAANLVAASLSLASNPTGGHQFLGNEVSAQITKAPATSSKPDFEIENAPLPLPKFEPAPPRLNQNNFDPSHFYGGGYEATAIFNPPISQSGVPKPPSIEPGFTMTINAVPPQVSNPNSSRFAPSLPKHESLDSDTPPKIPPKPPIIRKKLALVVQKDKLKNDYANCQKLRVTFENDLPTIEREKPVIIPGKKLAPKFENPSLPNLSKLAALSKSDSSSNEEGSSLAIDSSSLNPFSPNFRPENLSIAGGTIRPRVNSKVFDFAPKTLKRLSPDYDTNPFRQNVNSLSSSKSAFRLGEDFFTSLFSDSKPVAAPKGILKLPAISPSKDTDKDIVTNPSASHASGSNNVFSPTNPINLTNPNPTDSSSEPIPPRHHQHPSASLQPAKTGVVVHSGVALGAGMPPSSGQQGNKVMSQSDKYAALKDLDEIFKTSAVIQDSEFQMINIILQIIICTLF